MSLLPVFRSLRKRRRADSFYPGDTIYGSLIARREFTYCDDGRQAMIVDYEDGRRETFRPWSLVRP